jgi:hypothetical protein
MSMELVSGPSRCVGGEASANLQASSQSPGPSGHGRQEFNHVHTADNSRNHFGNAYYNVLPNAEQPESEEIRAKNLMKALEFDSMNDRIMTVSPACAQTCTWFLDRLEYTSWRDPEHREESNGVLWIKGKAGTGKSTLMRYIYDNAQKQNGNELHLSFFFNARSPDQLVKSIQGMYRSVIYQLYAKIPRIKAAASRRVTVPKQQVWSIKILEDMSRESVLGLASDEKATIYIDALDECDIDQVRSAVDLFEGLSRPATLEEKPFFICLSSRYYPQITMQCHAEVKLDTLMEHAENITTFLASNFTLQSPFRSELQAEIEKRCSGIFLWVVLVVQMLKRDYDKGANRSQLHETLKSLPHELSELFSRIIKTVGPEFAAAMRWVLCARSSLKARELYFAIQSSSKNSNSNSLCWDMAEIDIDAIRKYILHVSRGLIECTLLYRYSTEETVQFVHESVREYLLSMDHAIPGSVSLHKLEITSKAKMVEDCQNYLQHCAGCQFMELSPARMFAVKHGMLELFYLSHPLIDHVLAHVLTYRELAYNDGTAKSNVVDDFPINDYITTWNICSAIGRWAPLKIYGSPIIEGHPAVLLNLLTC